MNLKKPLLLILLTGASLLTVSCGDYVGKEKSHPFFVKAETSRSAGNYKEAAQYFEEFLNVCPRSPAVHYELAALYTDHLDDPYKAVYHYQRFLELNRNSPDAENIRTFIESAKRKIFEQLSKRFESADTARAYAEAEKTRKILDQYVAYSQKLRSQNDTLRAQNEEMRKRIESFAKESEKFRQTVKNLERQSAQTQAQAQTAGTEPPKPEKTSPAGEKKPAAETAQTPSEKPKSAETAQTPPQERTPAGTPPEKSGDEWENASVAAQSPNAAGGVKTPAQETPESAPAARRHQVQKGDTLYGIALKYYRKASAVRLIREANADLLKGRDLLQIGQILVIPPAPESKGGKK